MPYFSFHIHEINAFWIKFQLKHTCFTLDVPNAGRGLVRLDYRMKWDKDFREYLKKLDAEKPIILTGDLNVAHEEIGMFWFYAFSAFSQSSYSFYRFL